MVLTQFTAQLKILINIKNNLNEFNIHLDLYFQIIYIYSEFNKILLFGLPFLV